MKARIPIAWVTWSTLASMVLIFALQRIAGVDVDGLALHPDALELQQLLTYALVHAGLGHLLANASCLAYFGPRVEFALGPRRFAAYLASCAIAGGLCQAGMAWLPGSGISPTIATVGASGAVYGLLVAGWVLWPRDLAARASVIAYGGLVLVSAFTGGAGGHAATYAHMGGMAGGWLLLRAGARRVAGSEIFWG